MELLKLITAASEAALDRPALAHLRELVGGPAKELGWSYTQAAPGGHVVGQLTVDDRHRQPAGLVHGGIYTLMAEDLGSLAGLIAVQARVAGTAEHGRVGVVGVSNHTEFLSGMREGELIATVEPLHTGRRAQLFQIIFRDGERTVARSSLRTMVVGLD